jgi:hypothetical protein
MIFNNITYRELPKKALPSCCRGFQFFVRSNVEA